MMRLTLEMRVSEREVTTEDVDAMYLHFNRLASKFFKEVADVELLISSSSMGGGILRSTKGFEYPSIRSLNSEPKSH